MSYSSGRKPKSSPKSGNAWVFVVIALVIAGVIGIFASGLVHLPKGETSRERHERQFDAQVTADPRFAPLLNKFRTNFPADYAVLKTQEIDAYEAGSTGPQLEAISANFMRRFFIAHVGDIAVAPPEALKALRDAQLNTLTTLQKSSDALCSAYVNGRSQSMKDLDPASIDALTGLSTAMLDAVIAGRAKPTKRSALTNAEQIKWYRAMQRNGLSQRQADLLIDPATFAAAAAADQCQISIIIATSLNSLPPSVADKAIVAMITAGARDLESRK